MSLLDLFIVILAALSCIGGYRRGAVQQVVGLTGLMLGAVLSLGFAPVVRALVEWEPGRIILAALLIISCGIGGGVVGSVLARHSSSRRDPSKTDSLLGAATSLLALLVSTWFLGLNLAKGPFPFVARAVRGSGVVRMMDASLPGPPQLMPALQAVAGLFGVRDIFVGLPPVPLPAVDPPSRAESEAAARAGIRSSVEVLGRGCIPGFLNEGSGFVVAPGYVVTNAHVVAGTHGQFLYDGARYPATVVGFDPGLDIAILFAPSFRARPMDIVPEEVPRGTAGALVGFPGGFHPTGAPAAVRGVIDVLGRDIYGKGVVPRRLYEVQATITEGFSGGPFVLSDGRVAGLVVATSVIEADVAYAVVASDLMRLVEPSIGLTEAVSTGACTIGGTP